MFISFMETDNNRENQEERLLNNNENDKQNKEVLEEFKKEVQSIIEKHRDNFASIDELIKKIDEVIGNKQENKG